MFMLCFFRYLNYYSFSEIYLIMVNKIYVIIFDVYLINGIKNIDKI